MYRFSICTLILLILYPGSTNAQNLVPNPGFENRNMCPNSIGDFAGFVQDWGPSNNASPDYSGCTFTGNGIINNFPDSGTSSAGIWGGAGYGNCANGYSESIQANLTSPMVMGNTYMVQFRLRVDPTGSYTTPPSNCMDFSMYFYNSSSPPPSLSYCAHPVTPQFSVVGSLVPQGPYATFTGNIVAGNWDAVIIGPFSNANTPTGNCLFFNVVRNYFNLDNVVVQPVVVLDEVNFHFEGKAHSAFHALNWEVEAGHEYAGFKLERSNNGVDFHTIDERLSAPGQTLYQYLDQEPARGLNFYRLNGYTDNGELKRSSIVTLLRGENGDSNGGLLNYFYDAAAGQLHFSLDAGEGGPFRLELRDLHGREVISKNVQVASGMQEFVFPVNSVASGMYVLRAHALNRNAVWQARWIK